MPASAAQAARSPDGIQGWPDGERWDIIGGATYKLLPALELAG